MKRKSTTTRELQPRGEHRVRQRRGERRRGRRAIAPAGGGEEEAEDGEAAGRDAAEQGLYPLLLRGHGPGGQARALLHAPARPSGARHAICRGRLAAAQRLRRRELPLRGRRLVRHSLASPTTCAASAWTRSRTSRTTRSGCRRASRSACRSHARAACAQRCGRRRDGLGCTRVIVCVCITRVLRL